MASFKKNGKFKESPYYSGSVYSGSVPKLSRNPSKSEPAWLGSLSDYKSGGHTDFESLNGSSAVQKIVSGFERTFWSFRERGKEPLVSCRPTVVEEAALGENVAHETPEKYEQSFVEGDKTSMDGEVAVCVHNPLESSNVVPPPLKPIYASSEASPESSSILSGMSAPPPVGFIPRTSFDLTSSSLSSFPGLGDPVSLLKDLKPAHDAVGEESEGPNVGWEGTSSEQRLLEKNLSFPRKLEGTSVRTHIRRSSSVQTDMILEHAGGSTQKSAPSATGPINITTDPAQSLASESSYLPKEKTSSLEKHLSHEHLDELHKSDSLNSLIKLDDKYASMKVKDLSIAVSIMGSHKDEKMFLSGVAAAFYNGGNISLDGVLSCPSVNNLNKFLEHRLNELRAGVPGKWLTIVLGGESSDLSTIVATIMYAYFLTLTTKPDQLCIIPLVNMERADLALHPDVAWLLNSCGLQIASLLFLDEISLPYFHRFGCLRLVLVNHTKLSPSQEGLTDDVEEILAIHDEVQNVYPHLKTVISDKDVGSSCTIIAESFAQNHPEMLAGRAICRILLAGILLDTANLTTDKTTRRDICMATLLLNGAGRFGRTGLFKILKQKSHDLSGMTTNELLRKQFKLLNFGPKGIKSKGQKQQCNGYEVNVGMSSLPIPLIEVLKWEDDAVPTLEGFPRLMNLSLFLLVTGYYETQETFKREVLFVAPNNQLIDSISRFIMNTNKGLKFTTMIIQGFSTCMRAFTLEGKKISRAAIQSMIEEYFLG